MGSKKVEEKAQTLIHAFMNKGNCLQRHPEPSCLQSGSTYNYIERLKERGFELESTTRNKTAYYTLISEDPSAPPVYYLPISKKFYENTMLSRTSSANTTLRMKLLKDRYFLPGNNSKQTITVINCRWISLKPHSTICGMH